METPNTSATMPSKLDTAIKVLMIIKLVLQVAFWLAMLGTTIWLVTHNPLPEIMETTTKNIIKSFPTFGN